MTDTITSDTITRENILASLPAVLADDENMNALANAVADSLALQIEKIEKCNIYARIDELDEDLLDILAYDFKVDWWDYSFSIEKKRETLKRSWYVHKHMATPSAVKTALSAICLGAECEEWFEYDGKPYHFRLTMYLDAADILTTPHERVLALLRFYKNLRSVLDYILYIVTTPFDYTLSVDSHVGRGYMSTTLPEILPELIFEDTVVPVAGQVNVTDTHLPDLLKLRFENRVIPTSGQMNVTDTPLPEVLKLIFEENVIPTAGQINLTDTELPEIT